MGIVIRSVTSIQQNHRVRMIQGSFFWKDLLKLKLLFDWSTCWNIATGASISYWFDVWIYPPMREQRDILPGTRNWSLQRAVQEGMQQNFLETTSEERLS